MDWDDVQRRPHTHLRRKRFTNGELTCPDCGEEFRRIYRARNHNCTSRRDERFGWLSERGD